MPVNRIYKIVVVEDEPVILENTIKKITDASLFFKVVGSARNGKDAIQIIDSTKAEVLFTDIKMPKMDGLELIRQIKDKYPDMHILVLSGYNDFEYAQKALKLGVKDYLLKPLNIDSLKETLINIKAILDVSLSNVERDIMFSGINGLLYRNELPYNFHKMSFGVFLICIGHLCNHIPSSNQATFFLNVWSKIEWNHILPQNIGWWIIDEKQPNQKFLILSYDDPSESLTPIALRLEDSLSKSVYPLPVNICAGDAAIPYADTSILAQKLRILLDRCLVMGKSSLITPSINDKFSKTPAILDMIFQNKISTLINQENRVLLQKELYNQFEKWNQTQYPQRWVENVLHQLIKLFHRQFSSFTEEEIIEMEYSLNEKLSVSSGFSSIYEDLWLIFYSILMSNNDEKDDMKSLISNVDEYIIANYSTDLSIEDIARKFNFNPTYLTKVFKKFKNIAPAKYIISLRINEAKHLIEANPELGIKEIGEIVGYADQHYFSRVFKCITRKTPSEYRETMPDSPPSDLDD